MILKKLCLGVVSSTFIYMPAFAQDDLFTIDKSEVQSSWNDDKLDTDISKIAVPSLLKGPTTPVATQAGFDAFEREALTLSQTGPEGVSMRAGNMLISMGFQGHVRNATPPSWFEIYYAGGDVKDLSAARPEKQNGSFGKLEGKGFTPDGYFVADHSVNDIMYARYYFKIIKDGRSYFQPINSLDPAKKIVTLWQKVKTNVDAAAQNQARIAQIEADRRTRAAQAEQNRAETPARSSNNQISSYSRPTPKFFTGDFGRAPLSKEMQDIVDAGKGQVEGIYETQRQCRLVEDNDEVFIRSKKVCEDVQVLVGTRPVR